MAIVIVIYLAFLVFMIATMWKVFTKAGQPGWAIFIPIYNAIVFLKIAGKPWWWIFLFIIPIVNIVFLIMMINGVSKNFGQGTGFTVGLILLGFIFYPMLAFGDYQYKGVAPIATGKDQPLDAGVK